jgi:hypothetical protein
VVVVIVWGEVDGGGDDGGGGAGPADVKRMRRKSCVRRRRGGCFVYIRLALFLYGCKKIEENERKVRKGRRGDDDAREKWSGC